jgi:hypothetical protein
MDRHGSELFNGMPTSFEHSPDSQASYQEDRTRANRDGKMDSQSTEYPEMRDQNSEDQEMSEHDPPPSLGSEQENTESHTGTTGSAESDAIEVRIAISPLVPCNCRR